LFELRQGVHVVEQILSDLFPVQEDTGGQNGVAVLNCYFCELHNRESKADYTATLVLAEREVGIGVCLSHLESHMSVLEDIKLIKE